MTKSIRSRTKQLLASLAVGAAILSLTPIFSTPFLTAALAQDGDSVSSEFRTALSPYGTWKRHPRWGEVWVFNQQEADWRPYTRGRWIWTEEYGWYWDVGPEEYAWGWVTYHYGRWAYDYELGWVWIPGDEWGPAWVDWRQGDEYVGWAPLPPDDLLAEYREDPIYWSFVQPRYFLAPRVFVFCAPPRDRIVIIRKTKFVDRDRDRDRDRNRDPRRDRDRDRDRDGRRDRFNVGVDPGVIARATGKPIRAAKVEPVVLKGTKADGGREVDARTGGRVRASIKETNTVIKPTEKIGPPPVVGGRERGRIGDRPSDGDKRDAGGDDRNNVRRGADLGRNSDHNRASKDRDPSPHINVIRGGVSDEDRRNVRPPVVSSEREVRGGGAPAQRFVPPVSQQRRGENARANMPPPAPVVRQAPPPQVRTAPPPQATVRAAPPPRVMTQPRVQEQPRQSGGGGGNRQGNNNRQQDQRNR